MVAYDGSAIAVRHLKNEKPQKRTNEISTADFLADPILFYFLYVHTPTGTIQLSYNCI